MDVVIPESLGDLGSCDDGGGCSVAYAAAVEQAEGPGDHGGVGDLLGADFPLEVGLGAHRAVVVVLGGDLGECLLAFLEGDSVLVEVTGRGQSELGRRWHRRVHVRAGGLGNGQAGEAGVLELLDAEGQHDVVDARGNSVAGVAEGVGGGGAGIFDAGDGDVVQLERIGQRLTGAEGRDGAQPCRLNILAFDAGVFESLVGRLHHKVGGTGVPPLSELGATHADDGDAIFDSAHNKSLPLSWLLPLYVRQMVSQFSFQPALSVYGIVVEDNPMSPDIKG